MGIGSGTTSNCFIEANSAGTVITPSGNFCASAGNALTIAAATDGSGNAWFVGTNSVAKVNSTGAIVATGVNSSGCFDFTPTSATGLYNSTLNLAYERLNNHLWGASDLGLGALRADGSQIFCVSGATGYGLVAPYVTTMTSPTSVTVSSGYNLIGSIAVDGGGNLWFTTSGSATTVVIGNPTATVSHSTTLQELDPNGNPLMVHAGTASGIPLGQVNVGEDIAIDAYGNIWIIDGMNGVLQKLPGLAVPKNYQ